MLTSERRARRPPRSLRAEYDQFIEQRIEEYKDSLPRADILAIGDEAMHEMSDALQLQLTEVVLRDQVDSIIRRRLRLPSFRRWREKHVALRAAQVQPGHWGLGPHDPVAGLAELIEEGDPVLVIGAADGACPLFLAAHGATVHVCDPDIAAIYGLESRSVTEQLGALIECSVIQLERFEPFAWFVACVIEAAALSGLRANERAMLIERLKAVTPEGGRHVIMPVSSSRGPREARLASDALKSSYVGWDIIRPNAPVGRGRGRNIGFTAVRPRRSDTEEEVSN